MVKFGEQNWKQRVEAIERQRQFLMERLQPTLEEDPRGDGAVTLISSTLNNMHIIN